MSEDRLVLREGKQGRRIDYDLAVPATPVIGVGEGQTLPASAEALMISQKPVTWADWIGCWAADEAGAGTATRAPGLPDLSTKTGPNADHAVGLGLQPTRAE